MESRSVVARGQGRGRLGVAQGPHWGEGNILYRDCVLPTQLYTFVRTL